MNTVEVDREDVALKALCFFRGRIKHKIAYSDKEWLEGQANLSIAKALDGFDPERGMKPLSWCIKRLNWDINSAIRKQIKRLSGRREIQFSAIESLDSIVPSVDSIAESKMIAEEIEGMIQRRPVSDRDGRIIREFLAGESKAELARKNQLSPDIIARILREFMEMVLCGSHLVRSKKCWDCSQTKSFKCFRREKRSRDGLHDRCSKCAERAKAKRKRKQLVFENGRICSTCLVFKDFEAFWKVKVGSQKSRCKECESRLSTEFKRKKKTMNYCIDCKEWKCKSLFGPSFKLKGRNRFKCGECSL